MIRTFLTIIEYGCFGIAAICAVKAIFLIIKRHIDWKRVEKEMKEEEEALKAMGIEIGDDEETIEHAEARKEAEARRKAEQKYVDGLQNAIINGLRE